MALDSKEKRMAVVGVGRPWMRTKLPGTNDQEWRIASGNAYGGNPISIVIVTQTQVGRVAVSSSQIGRDPHVMFDAFDIDRHVQAEIDDRLVDSPTGSYKNLFSPAYANGGDNTWNTSCWAAGLNFTGLSPWNSDNPNFGGVLISRRHVLFVWHSDYTPAVDTEIVFVKADGSECSRTITGRERVGVEDDLTDLGVCYLDEDVPSDVTFYKCTMGHRLGWMELSKYYNLPYTRGDPVVVCDKEEKALVGEVNYVVIYVGEYPNRGFYIIQGDSPRDAYWEGMVPGDSGHPSFLILDDELVLLGLHSRWYPNKSPPTIHDVDVGIYYLLIDAAMSELDTADTGYQVTLFDFEVFIAHMRRESVAASRIGRVAVGSNTIARV